MHFTYWPTVSCLQDSLQLASTHGCLPGTIRHIHAFYILANCKLSTRQPATSSLYNSFDCDVARTLWPFIIIRQDKHPTSSHPSPADEVWYWPKCILCSGWLFREMWFIEPSYKTKQFSMKCSSYHFVWSLKIRVLPFPSPSHWLSWWWFWYSPARPFSRSCALFLVGSPVWQYTSSLTQAPHHWCSLHWCSQSQWHWGQSLWE